MDLLETSLPSVQRLIDRGDLICFDKETARLDRDVLNESTDTSP